MNSPILSEGAYSGEFLVSEANNNASRNNVVWDNTAGTSAVLVRGGTVFSVAAFGQIVATPAAGNTGNGTISGISVNPEPTQLGTYIITFLTATTYGVKAPDGSVLSQGTVGVPYMDGIGFLITAGSAAYFFGDSYAIAIATGSAPVVTAAPGNFGNGTLGSVKTSFVDSGMAGEYEILFTSPTSFTVAAPDGRMLAPGTVGAPYEDEISFVIGAGGVAYVKGDAFTISIASGTRAVTFFTGAAPAAGVILFEGYVPAGATKPLVAITSEAEINGSALQYLPSVTAGARLTAQSQLRQAGIITL